MAQDFERVYKSQVTSSAHTLLTSNSDDALIGIRLTNITTAALTVSFWIDAAGAGSTASIVYLAKDLTLSPNGSIELIQGGAKINMLSGDVLKAQSSASNSVAAYVSYIDAIST